MMKSGRLVRPLLLNGCFSRTFCASDRYSENSDSCSPNPQGHSTAYQILGVPSTCSQECIRQAFRKLAKLTHPDMQSGNSSSPSSEQFVVILSAYQILSDPEKRAQYDSQLRTCSSSNLTTDINVEIRTDINISDDLEVVEWLRWYRKKMMTLIHQEEIGTGNHFQCEARNLQEALKRAYFGPQIEDNILPNCFEAEERANESESEVLHLVSGHYFIGAVIQSNQPSLLDYGTKVSMSLSDSQINEKSHIYFPQKKNLLTKINMLHQNRDMYVTELEESKPGHSAFVDLELYLYGNLVARARRSYCKENEATESELNVDGTDEIKIYLCNNADEEDNTKKNKDVLLGRILGLNTTESGEKGKVFSPNGEHTHLIWQFRTPWVKHMHWFKIDGKQMLCECRSSRARLPSSKYWLFQPRSRNHNIGGWYIEMLWRNKENQTHLTNQLGLLHPAIYIFATAYKTLDAEYVQRRKSSLWSELFKERALIAAVTRVIRWCMTRLPSN